MGTRRALARGWKRNEQGSRRRNDLGRVLENKEEETTDSHAVLQRKEKKLRVLVGCHQEDRGRREREKLVYLGAASSVHTEM